MRKKRRVRQGKKIAAPLKTYLTALQEKYLSEGIETMVPSQMIRMLTKTFLKNRMLCGAYNVLS